MTHHLIVRSGILALLLWLTMAAPAMALAIDTFAEENYCTLLLAPKLVDKLNLNRQQRRDLSAAQLKLEPALTRAATDLFVGRPPSVGMASVRTRSALGEAGRSLRIVLTAEQDRQLRELFNQRVLEPVTVREAAAGSRGLVIGQIEITFTRYEPADEPGAKKPGARRPPIRPETRPTTAPADDDPPLTALRPGRRQAVQTLPEALTFLKSSDPADQAEGAKFLVTAPVDPARRTDVLKLLAPRLRTDEGKQRLAFVEAYAVWADRTGLEALQGVLDYPKMVETNSRHERCWAAAVEALVRLDPAAAERAVNKRIDSAAFRKDAVVVLRLLANGDDAAVAAHARRLIDLLNSHEPQPKPRPQPQPPADKKPPGDQDKLPRA